VVELNGEDFYLRMISFQVYKILFYDLQNNLTCNLGISLLHCVSKVKHRFVVGIVVVCFQFQDMKISTFLKLIQPQLNESYDIYCCEHLNRNLVS